MENISLMSYANNICSVYTEAMVLGIESSDT